MEHWEIFIGILALAAGLWQQLKSIGHWFESLFIQTCKTDEALGVLILTHCSAATKKGRNPSYESTQGLYVKPLGKKRRVAYELMMARNNQIVWCKGFPMRYKLNKEEDLHEAEGSASYAFSFIRRTVDFDALIIKVLEASEEAHTRVNGYVSARYKVIYHQGSRLGSELAKQRDDDDGHGSLPKDYNFLWNDVCGRRLLQWQYEDLTSSELLMSIEGLALMPNVAQMAEEIKDWHTRQSWYRTRRIPWRRGYLLHGLPGTGKTTMVREISAALDMPVHVMDLGSMSNGDLHEAWTKAIENTPCTILIEDVDSVFQGRKNIAQNGGMMSSGGLTFDCLLNCVDGVERADGCLLLITTNDAGSIDPALLRPGRVDKKVEFPLLDFERRLKLAKQILEDDVKGFQMAQDSGDMAAAEFVEKCCREALKDVYAGEAESAKLIAIDAKDIVELKREVPKKK